MIGIDLAVDFPSASCAVQPGDQLLVYSDGVFEIPKTDGTMWDFDQFLALLGRAPPDGASRIEWLLDYTRALQGGDEFTDDFSVVQVVF